MKLLNLELENWACHESLKISLERGLQIEGRNGTGKSSILEAIRFIFAEHSRGYKNRIKNGKKTAKVVLRLKKDNEIYYIEKILFSATDTKTATTKARMFMKRSETSHYEQIADNSSSVSSRLKEILSEEILEKLAYVPQGKLTEIIDALKIKGGRQELDSLLGLDKFEKVYKGASEELIKIREQENLLFSEMEKFPKDAENFYKNEIKNFEDKIKNLEHNIKELEKKKDETNKKLSSMKEKIDEIEKIKDLKEKLEKEISKRNLELARLQEELNAAKNFLTSSKEKEEEIKKLEKEKFSLERYPKIRDFLLEKKNLDEKLNELKVDSEKEKVEILKREVSKKEELFSAFKEKEKFILELEKKIAILKEKFSALQEFISSLLELTKEKKCPRCKQILSKEHIAKEKKESEKEIEKIKVDLSEKEKNLKDEKILFERIKEKVDELKKKEIELKNFQEQMDKKIFERKKSENKIKNLNTELTKLNYANETLQEVESRINSLNKILGSISQLKKDVEKEKIFVEKIPKLESSISKLNQEKEQNEKKFNELKYDEPLFLALKKDKEILQENFYKIFSEIQNVDFQRKNFEEKLDEVKEKEKEFLEKKEKYKEVKKEVNLLEKARDLFHTDKGIPKYLRERYISQLNFLLTNYFKKLNQNPFYKEINFNKEYELEIKTQDGVLNIDQISGGEKSQLAIAFRISLIDLLSPIRLLILDEPFGSLDKEHREILGESMNKIAEEGQLILVTHIPVDSLQLAEKLDLGGY